MASPTQSHLRNLLIKFNAFSLGEGDYEAGANILAAMAVTLANVSRPGSGIQTPAFSRIHAGISLLVSGRLSASLVRDTVLTQVTIRQNNLTAHLRRQLGNKMEDAAKKGTRMAEFPKGAKPNRSENLLFQLEQPDSGISSDAVEKWGQVVINPPNPRIEDLAARPKIAVCASSAATLRDQLSALHAGRPFVILGLYSAAEVANCSYICNALIDGLLPDGPDGETISGNILVTDPTGILQEATRMPEPQTGWTSRALWLVDSAPATLSYEKSEGTDGNISGRFGSTLSRVFGTRLNNHTPGPILHEVEFDASQMRWIEYLKSLEPRLSGITGTARRLLATLTFGLLELARRGEGWAGEAPEISISMPEIEAFARHLVDRMAEAHESFTTTAETERNKELVRRLFVALGEGAMSKRDLYRRLGISAAACDELLLEMGALGLVKPHGKEWQRIESATPQLLPARMHS